MNDQPRVSIIIVNHYAEAVLGDCLKAISAGRGMLEVEVILIDNPIDPEAKPIIIPNDLRVIRIAAPRRLGFGAACNLGARHASGEYVLLLNPDVVVSPDTIRTLYQTLINRPSAGMAVGRLTFEDGSFQPSCRRFPTLKNMAFSRGSIFTLLSGSRTRRYTLPDYPGVTEVEAAAAAMMMVRRELFEDLKGFDESFFMYMEDTDLCCRAQKRGCTVIFVPAAVATHRWGISTGRYPFRRIAWHHRAIWRYFAKHRRADLPILLPLLAVNCGLSLLRELVTFRK